MSNPGDRDLSCKKPAASRNDAAGSVALGMRRAAFGRAASAVRRLAGRCLRLLHLIHASTLRLILRHIRIRFLVLADAVVHHLFVLCAFRIGSLSCLTLMRRRAR